MTPYRTAATTPATIPTSPPIPAINVGAAPPTGTWEVEALGVGVKLPVAGAVVFPTNGGAVVDGAGMLVVSAVTVVVDVVDEGVVVVVVVLSTVVKEVVVEAEAVAMAAK